MTVELKSTVQRNKSASLNGPTSLNWNNGEDNVD